jgi:hypothetical protein
MTSYQLEHKGLCTIWDFFITSEMTSRPTWLLPGAHSPGLQQLECEMEHFSASSAYLIFRKDSSYGNNIAVHSNIVFAVHVHYKLQVYHLANT